MKQPLQDDTQLSVAASHIVPGEQVGVPKVQASASSSHCSSPLQARVSTQGSWPPVHAPLASQVSPAEQKSPSSQASPARTNQALVEKPVRQRSQGFSGFVTKGG
jgi:hypothetical protein